MDDSCKHDHGQAFAGNSNSYRRALWIVIVINAAMFIVEIVAGSLAYSKALQADALDFAADSATYALSLAAIGWPVAARAKASLFKSASLALIALWVLGSSLYQTLVLKTPDEAIMGAIGFLALAANLSSAVILMRYRDGDSNVRSVWLCTRNDAIGNVAVMLAAIAVAFTRTAWPDLIVAFVMAILFLSSSIQIARQAWVELQDDKSVTRN